MIFIIELLQFVVLIPAAILALIPLKNQLRYSIPKVAGLVALTLGCLIPFCGLIVAKTGTPVNYILSPLMIVLYLCYHGVSKVSVGVDLSIYLFVIALMSFPANFAVAIDCQVHPDGKLSDPCLLACVWQVVFSFLFLLLFAWFFHRILGFLVDNISSSWVWLATIPIPLIFTCMNVLLQPHYYETMHVNRVFSIYICYHPLALVLIFTFYIIFYLVAMELLRNAKNAERIRFLEMQESQYLSQQQYIAESARLRHDFRQQLHSLAEMAMDGNYEQLTEHLVGCVNALPKQPVNYCRNLPLNALFSYYASLMDDAQIQRNWKISLPEKLPFPITDMELCSLLGNILENVWHGCQHVQCSKRYHDLTICVKHEKSLYIISSNCFNGEVKKENGIYLSTQRNGSGIGLSSISTIAERHGGIAQFSHTEDTFVIDVVIGK
mgnify:FL=1